MKLYSVEVRRVSRWDDEKQPLQGIAKFTGDNELSVNVPLSTETLEQLTIMLEPDLLKALGIACSQVKDACTPDSQLCIEHNTD